MSETSLPEGVAAGIVTVTVWLGAAKRSVAIFFPWFYWGVCGGVHVPGFTLQLLGPSLQHQITLLHPSILGRQQGHAILLQTELLAGLTVFPPTCLQTIHSCCFPESAT